MLVQFKNSGKAGPVGLFGVFDGELPYQSLLQLLMLDFQETRLVLIKERSTVIAEQGMAGHMPPTLCAQTFLTAC